VDSLVRALLGQYPRAFVRADGGTFSIRGVDADQTPTPTPAARLAGQPAATDDRRIRFRCSDGVLDLLRADHDDGAQP